MIKEGWYVQNSVVLRNIVPEYGSTGGGITSSMLCDTKEQAYQRAIKYSKQHIAEAEAHIRKLEKALDK